MASEADVTEHEWETMRIPASQFEGRGAYGQYFAHLATETAGQAGG